MYYAGWISSIKLCIFVKNLIEMSHDTNTNEKKGIFYTYLGKGGAGVIAFLWIIALLAWIFGVLKWG